jgi:hypothetical protein
MLYTCIYCILAFKEYYQYFGLALSITIVRQMAESEIFEALQKGSVSWDQYRSSCAAQGHTEQTAKKYYRISRVQVAHATTAYASVMGDNLPTVQVSEVSVVVVLCTVYVISMLLLC